MMHHLKIVFTLLFLTFLSSVFAQSGSISGVIHDQESGDKVPFATVSVYNNSEDLVTGAVSSEKGKFKIEELEFGAYKLVVSFIGYDSKSINSIVISEKKTNVNLGEVGITPSAVQLESVEVKGMASSTSKKIDRQTYRASDFETASGGTAADVLNKIPSVSVGPDGTVSLRGTTDFMVYLNGKPTQMEASVLLNQIAASNIQSIDVITVPTARFDAQGKGGIINISTKKSGADGLSISANGLLGGAPWANVTDKYDGYELNDSRYGGGVNLVYRKEDLTLYGGGSYNYKNVNGARVGDARILQENGSYYHMVASGERPEWYENYSANVGLDWEINDMSTISASYYYGNRTEGRSAFYVYNNFYGDINKNPIPGIDPENHWIYNPNTDNRYGKFHTANIDLIQKFENKSQITFSLLYEHSGLSRELQNQNFAFDKNADKVGDLLAMYHQSDNAPLDGVRTSIEYEKEYENKSKLALGFQPQFVNQKGAFNYDTLNIETGDWGNNSILSNSAELSRAIYAGYGEYSGAFGDWNVVAGLRMEYTDQLLEIGNPDYLNIFDRPTKPEYKYQKLDWFPTLHVKYNLNENDGIIFAASRRINRPPTKNMAPFLYRRHYEVYVVGDPELEPEYLTNFELSYDKKIGEQQFSLTGFYRGTNNAIFRVNTVYQEENVLIRSYTNSGDVQALGAELNANLSAGKFAKFFVGGSLYDFHVQGDVFGYQEDNSSTNWSLKGNMNLFFARDIKFTFDVDWSSSTVTTQGGKASAFMSNAALNYTPKKLPGWDFSAKMLNIFDTNQDGLYTRAYNENGTQIFYQDVEYDRNGPIVELAVSYSLNLSNKSKKKADSVFGKEQF